MRWMGKKVGYVGMGEIDLDRMVKGWRNGVV